MDIYAADTQKDNEQVLEDQDMVDNNVHARLDGNGDS